MAADTGTDDISLLSDTLTITGGTGVATTIATNEVTIDIGQSVATDADVTFATVETSGNVIVGGNLTVNGTTTTVNSNTVNIGDSILTLNSDETGTPSQNGGLEIERGTSSNVSLLWDETADKWTVGSGTFVAATFEGDLTGNSGTATTLETARTIAGNSFDGSANITIAATDLSDTNQSLATTDDVTFNTVTADLTGDVTGNASTATTLETARTIGGVSFNGSANINLPGVNASGNQDTSGNAATATALETARTIGGVSFDGTANINLPGVNASGNQDTSGNAATATALETARTIGGVSFDGTANINLPGVNASGNQDTSGNAATATALETARTIAGQSFDGTGNISIAPTDLTGVTSTAAEINKLDGFTGTVDDLNYAKDLRATGVTDTEFDFLDGVTSNIQTQLNAKQATITGAATTIDDANLTASRALVSDGSGKVAVSAVTSTEIGYLDGVSSAIQTQLNAKAPLANPAFTGTATGVNLTLSGNLTVNGTTTTVNSNTVNIGDNILLLNSDETGTPSQDGGLEIERGTSSNKTLVWDESADKWTVGSETFVAGTVEADLTGAVTGNVTGDVTGNADTATALATSRNFSVTGAVATGSAVSFDGSGNVALNVTQQNDSVTLGTHTTGNYVATISAGAGISVSGSGSESATVTIASTIDANIGKYKQSTLTSFPGDGSDVDFGASEAYVGESGGTDAFGISLIDVFSAMDPLADTDSLDLGALT